MLETANKKWAVGPISPLIIGILILFGVQIITGQILFWGAPSLQFVPWWQRAVLNIQQGQLPLWNPDVGMGAPLLANYQLGFFYPPNWLYLLFGLFFGARGIGWIAFVEIAFHVFWAGLGMLYLTKALGLNRFSQIISAIAFSFSGYLIARAWFLSINASIAWLPWIMFFSYQIICRAKRRELGRPFVNWKDSAFWLLVGSLSCQLLSGHAQTTFFTLTLLLFWSLFWINSDSMHVILKLPPGFVTETAQKNIKPFRIESLVIIAVALMIAVGIAAIQLLPTAEYLFNSPRSTQVDYELAMTYSMWPWRLLGIFAPSFFGNPAYGNFWGYGNFWEDAIYIGMLPIILALAVLIRRPKSAHKPFVVFGGVFILVSIILALGKNTPVYPFLYKYIPGFDMFQAPSRWSILGIFFLAIIAGIGSQLWVRPTGRALYWSRLGTVAAFAITVGSGIGWLVLQGQTEAVRLATMVSSVMVAGVFLLSAGFLTLTAPVSQQNNEKLSRWQWITVGILVIDLCIASWGLNPGGSRQIYAPGEDIQPSGRVYMAAEDENYLKFEKYFQFKTFYSVADWQLLRKTFLSNFNSLVGMPSVLNFDPLVSARQTEYVELLNSGQENIKSILMNLASVSLVVRKDLSLPSGAAYVQVTPGPYLRWYSCANYYPDSKARITNFRLHLPEADDYLFLEDDFGTKGADCSPRLNDRLQLVENLPQYKYIQVESDHAGWVFISESFYPGWRAKLDGEPVEIYPANLAFQAISVPPGDHGLEIYYFPVSFIVGFIISISVLIMCIFALLWVRMRNNQEGRRK